MWKMTKTCLKSRTFYPKHAKHTAANLEYINLVYYQQLQHRRVQWVLFMVPHLCCHGQSAMESTFVASSDLVARKNGQNHALGCSHFFGSINPFHPISFFVVVVSVNTKTQTHYGSIPLSHEKIGLLTFWRPFPQHLHCERGISTLIKFIFRSTCVSSVMFSSCG